MIFRGFIAQTHELQDVFVFFGLRVGDAKMLERLKLPVKIATGFLVACLVSFPVNVNALGFGNINMKSALNEPLSAEIELLSATPDDIKVLEVKLASKEAFLRAGVDRSVLLSQIKFNVVKRSGKYYINLHTQESVREPFLNFLLEMNWKSGRMLREYTVLLDPPLFDNEVVLLNFSSLK